MTKFTVILAIPAPDPLANNQLLLSSVGDCDKAGLLVDEAYFNFHRFEFNSAAWRSLILKASGETAIHHTDSDGLEDYIKELWAVNDCKIDAQTVSAAFT